MTYTQEKFVSWDEIQVYCRLLAQKIIALNCPHRKILAITRGGLFPAGVLARELNIRDVEVVGINSYNLTTAGATARGEAEISKMPAPEYRSGVIVVDDLVDTGATLKVLRPRLGDHLCVCVYAKPAGEDMVDLYHEKVAQDVWIRFPWDTTRQYIQPLVKDDH